MPESSPQERADLGLSRYLSASFAGKAIFLRRTSIHLRLNASITVSCHSHPEWCAAHNSRHDGGEPVVFARSLSNNFTHSWHVMIVQTTSQGIGQQALSKCCCEGFGMPGE